MRGGVEKTRMTMMRLEGRENGKRSQLEEGGSGSVLVGGGGRVRIRMVWGQQMEAGAVRMVLGQMVP